MTISTVVLVGDSYTAAFNSSSVAAGGLGSWGEQLAERLADLKIFGPLLSSGCIIPSNGAWQRTGTWTRALVTDAFNKCPYDQSYYGTTTTDITTFTRPTQWRTPVGFALYWTDHAAGGDWQYRLDGGAWVNMGQTRVQDNSLNKFYVNSAFTNTVDVRCFNGTSNVGALIVGIELYWANPTTAASGVIVHNLAVAGNLLHTLTASGAGDGLAFFDAIKLGSGSPISSAPTVATLMMHENDVALNNVSNWATDLTTFRNRAAPFAPVIFTSPWGEGSVDNSYRAQTKTSAASYSPPVTVVDLFDEWTVLGFPTIATLFAGGFIDGTSHPAQPGNNKIAERLYHELRTTVLAARIGPYRNWATSGTTQDGSTTDVQAGFPGASVATADTAGGTDAVSRGTVRARTTADTAGGTDAVTRVSARARGTADTAGGTDAVVRGPFAPARSLADTAGGTDAVTRAVIEARTASDTAGGTDAVTRIPGKARATADTAGGTDTATRGAVLEARATSDTAGGTDSPTRAVVEARATADTAGGTDVVTRAPGKARGTADAAGGTDSTTRAVIEVRATADTAGGTDTTVRLVVVLRATSDTAGGTDTVTRVPGKARSLIDAAGGTDAISAIVARARISADTAGGTDVNVRILRTFRTTADTAGGTDVATSMLVPVGGTTAPTFTFGVPLCRWTFGKPDVHTTIDPPQKRWLAHI